MLMNHVLARRRFNHSQIKFICDTKITQRQWNRKQYVNRSQRQQKSPLTGVLNTKLTQAKSKHSQLQTCKLDVDADISHKRPTSARLATRQTLKLLYILSHHSCLTFSHWLKISEHIEHKLLSLTYKVLTTTQPPYLHHLISVQPPRSTRSSSLVTLARPPTSSSLRITDRSFRYALPCLWNQLPSSLRQPHLSPSVYVLPVHAPTTSSRSVNLPLSPSITPSLFHSRLKTYLFHKSVPP